MKKIICGLSLLLMFACQSDEVITPQDRKDIELTRSEQEMTKEGNSFAFNLLGAVEKNETKENYFISPLSASLALSMTTNGAATTTLAEMKRVLGFDAYSIDEMNEFYKKLVAGLLSVDNTTQIGIANSIWIKEGFLVHSPFKNVNQEMYDAEVRNLDFSSPQAVPTINSWCADKTNGKVKEIIKNISDDVRLFLINTLYFKGVWKFKFDAKQTVKADFTNKDGSKSQVDMMRQETVLPYTEDTDIQIAEFPYGNEAFSMVVLLPQGSNTPEKVISGLTTEKWTGWMDRLTNSGEKLNVYFPKFKMEYEKELNDDLKMLGMIKAFSDADFSKISDISLFISKVKQKTFVEVNEEGTEAAAVTLVEIMQTSVDPNASVRFSMDRPFVYVIKEKSTGAILFLGKMGKL